MFVLVSIRFERGLHGTLGMCRYVKLTGTMQRRKKALLLKLCGCIGPFDLNLASMINNACTIVSILHLDKTYCLEVL